MTTTTALTLAIDAIKCGTCNVWFGIERGMLSNLRETGNWFWCPNGCRIYYFEDENTKLRKEAERLRKTVEAEREYARSLRATNERVNRRLSAAKGQITKARKRAAAALCPVEGCKRSFVNVAKHIETCHPDWHHDHPAPAA